MTARRGRGRINAFDGLPDDCDQLIADAATALQDRDKTQLEIYTEFYDGCQALMRDSHGEISFAVPSKSAFNRYSIRLATMTRRLEETREIAAAISKRFDAEASDDLTLIAAEAIKTAIWEVLQAAGPGKIDPKGAADLANALRAATAAQGLSTKRRLQVEADFKDKATAAVGAAAKVKGLTSDVAEEILAKILGVEKKS